MCGLSGQVTNLSYEAARTVRACYRLRLYPITCRERRPWHSDSEESARNGMEAVPCRCGRPHRFPRSTRTWPRSDEDISNRPWHTGIAVLLVIGRQMLALFTESVDNRGFYPPMTTSSSTRIHLHDSGVLQRQGRRLGLRIARKSVEVETIDASVPNAWSVRDAQSNPAWPLSDHQRFQRRAASI